MPTLKLYFNNSNSVPSSSDPVHYRSFTVDFCDDRGIEEVKDTTVLLNKTLFDDVYGIRRKLLAFLRTTDIKNNIDFLFSFFNASYKWAVVTDAGYYFNLGSVASPVAVPVNSDMKEVDISVPGLMKNGLILKTSNIYQRPTAPTAPEIDAINTGASTDVYCTTTKLKMRAFKSDTSGGTYVYIGESSSNLLNHVVASNKYYKITAVTIGGESELSPYVLAHV